MTSTYAENRFRIGGIALAVRPNQWRYREKLGDLNCYILYTKCFMTFLIRETLAIYLAKVKV